VICAFHQFCLIIFLIQLHLSDLTGVVLSYLQ
jgi:hypothetical protein